MVEQLESFEQISMLEGSCIERMSLVSQYFFFQAEDGIRDYKVTGVQTCALPIYRRADEQGRHGGRRVALRRPHVARRARGLDQARSRDALERPRAEPESSAMRSEERRVGEECRSRWVAFNLKKKNNREVIKLNVV